MTLLNLLRIGKLKEHAPTAAEVQRLLVAIERNLADAAVASISDETRLALAQRRNVPSGPIIDKSAKSSPV